VGASNPRRRLCESLALVVITDRKTHQGRAIIDVVRAALAAGAPCVQLREKDLPPRDLLPLARALRETTSVYDALFIVNDRLDLALAVGADGVHVGPDDIPVKAIREIVKPDFIVGYSTSDLREGKTAETEGASYLGCGPLFPTDSKADAGHAVGIAGLRILCNGVTLPVVGIGGVTAGKTQQIREAGAAGSAVISAVMSAVDVSAAVSKLL